MLKLSSKRGGDGWGRQLGRGCLPLKGVGMEKQTKVLPALTPSGIPTLKHTQRRLIIFKTLVMLKLSNKWGGDG